MLRVVNSLYKKLKKDNWAIEKKNFNLRQWVNKKGKKALKLFKWKWTTKFLDESFNLKLVELNFKLGLKGKFSAPSSSFTFITVCFMHECTFCIFYYKNYKDSKWKQKRVWNVCSAMSSFRENFQDYRFFFVF